MTSPQSPFGTIFKPFVDEYSLFDCELLSFANGKIDYTFFQEGSGKILYL